MRTAGRTARRTLPLRILLLAGAAAAVPAPATGDDGGDRRPAVRININTSSDLDRFPLLREAGFTVIYDGTAWSRVEAEKVRIDYTDLDALCAKAHANGLSSSRLRRAPGGGGGRGDALQRLAAT